MAFTIKYSASNEHMGDTSPKNCAMFRDWAEKELKKQFPTHKIEVTEGYVRNGAWTDNLEHEDEILDACKQLWGNCSWDWIDFSA
jgi:hypothetical protein